MSITTTAYRCRHVSLWLVTIVTLVNVGHTRATASDHAVASTPAEAIEFFEKAVRPVLVEHCQSCHGPLTAWAELRVDSRQAMLQGGESGPAMVVGDAGASELILRVTAEDESLRMPPSDEGA